MRSRLAKLAALNWESSKMNVRIDKLNLTLPEVCTNKDLCINLPDVFGSRSTICRLRMKGEVPPHTTSDGGNIFYRREDVIKWLRKKYGCEKQREEIGMDKKIKKIEKSLKKDVKDMKHLESMDRKRDKVCEMGEKAMKKKKKG